MSYKNVVDGINRLFKKYSLHYEMRKVKDRDYGEVYKIYYIPYEGRAKCVVSGVLPGQAIEYFAYYFAGPEKAQVQYVYNEFRNSTW